MEQVSSTPQANFNESKPQNSAYKITFRKIARAAAAEVRVHKKIAIISYVLYGVATLLFMFNASYYGRSGDYGFTTVSFSPSGWGIAFCVMGVLVGFFAALNVFRDVNNQQLCDVTMALPIKAAERFWSKLLALVYLQVAPLLVSTLCGNAIAMLFGRIGHGPLDSEAFDILTVIILATLSCSLFIMAVTVFCTCCSGAKAESAYFSLIMMFIINALPLTYVYNIIGNVSGFSMGWFYGDSGIDVNFWGFLPLFTDIYDSIGDFVFHNVISIAISLCVMFLSIFIYKKRDARTVGTPISSRLFFEIFLVLGCFTIFSFFVFSEAAWWGVLIAGVIYIIINIIVSRAKINVMSFFTWIVKYAVTTAVFVVFMVVTVKTGGFGQIYSRPSEKYLEGAGFDITCYDYSNGSRIELTTEALSAEQADQVMTICKKHMTKGFYEIPAASLLTENGNLYYSRANVNVRATSKTEFRERPLSMRHFYRDTVWVKNSDYSYVVYRLDYWQSLKISSSELRAMCDELEKLDFVYSETYRNGKVITTKYGEPIVNDGGFVEYY